MTKLFYKKLSDKAITPTRGNSTDAGLDVYATSSALIEPNSRAMISTDICFGIPEGYYLRVAPRSGLAYKKGLDILAGVIDSSYIGHCKIIIQNTDKNNSVEVNIGDKIAQLILERIDIPELVEVESLGNTERGSAGFGSTGYK